MEKTTFIRIIAMAVAGLMVTACATNEAAKSSTSSTATNSSVDGAAASEATKASQSAAASSVSSAERATAAESAPSKKAQESRGVKGEVIGKAVPGSKFSQLVIGMKSAEVQNILDRAPDRSHTYESGKRWIPFYYGGDARRAQVLYKGEGCLTYTDGNIFGGGGGTLITIIHDPSGACYRR